MDKSPSISSAIDLVLTDSSKVETVPVQKPKLSQKAWNRLSNRNRRKVNPGSSEGRTGQLKESSPLANDTGIYIYYVCVCVGGHVTWSCDLQCLDYCEKLILVESTVQVYCLCVETVFN